ncbi:retrovirus-related Pol polyprotein from transposon 412 [Trichonephila clavipes]|nr:retrovirus-related Pol polyprotein from transposon 412 [Trichonephila clavipes]
MIEFKESSDEKPSWQDIAPLHPTTKRYWALWNSLHLRNGVLYQKWESDDGRTFRWQFILPKTRVSTVLKELHGSPTGGHFGVMKTLQKVRPLPRSSDGKSNILVVKDYFTKWPEAYPIPDQEDSTVAEVLVQHWISRFGVSLQLHSAQGRNFDSAVCKRLWEILAIDKTTTIALHPQSDGMVERFNRTILNSLSLSLSWYPVINRTGTGSCPFSCLPTGVPFMRELVIPHPRCSLDVIFVCLQIFCSASYQMHTWRLRSISRNSRHGWRKCIIWLGKDSAWLPRR